MHRLVEIAANFHNERWLRENLRPEVVDKIIKERRDIAACRRRGQASKLLDMRIR